MRSEFISWCILRLRDVISKRASFVCSMLERTASKHRSANANAVRLAVMKFMITCSVVMVSLSSVSPICAQDVPNELPSKANEARSKPRNAGGLNLSIKTLGGTQFWTDLRHQRGWRIQQNCVTGHCRLLSPNGTRKGWGTFEECCEVFEVIRTEQQLTPVAGKVVIVLHGLGRTRKSMQPLAEYLQEQTKFEVINFGYASTRKSVQDHSQALAKVIEGLPQVTEISFVCHSLGNIVVRNYVHSIGEKEAGKRQTPKESRLKRMVMLGPPNNGAQLARRFDNLPLFKMALGASAVQLADEWETLEPKLAVPSFEFGIVAGRVGANPLIDGDDDLVVAVEETKLSGAADFCVVECAHTTLMNDAQVREKLTRFLQHGYFVSPEQAQPIR